MTWGDCSHGQLGHSGANGANYALWPIPKEVFIEGGLVQTVACGQAHTVVITVGAHRELGSTLAVEGNYYADLQHGAWTEYYTNGRPKLEGHYHRGEPQGPWAEYAETGQKTSAGTMEGGHPEGPWTYWNELGQRLREGGYINGEQDGEWTYYRPDGTVRLVRTYRRGRLIQQVEQ